MVIKTLQWQQHMYVDFEMLLKCSVGVPLQLSLCNTHELLVSKSNVHAIVRNLYEDLHINMCLKLYLVVADGCIHDVLFV